MQIIKDELPCILPILTDIVNHSLLSSVFPQAWKISEIIPLLKEGDHEVANNNRPISLLPAASKVCERVALNQFTQFMKAKKRLTEHQSGNKAMHSTETMNVMMTDQMLQAMDDKKLSIVVLLDFSKAFDSIDHNKLLSKLKSLGTSSFALDWFRNYLKDRRQYVRIGSEHSTLCGLSHGVPQGSILGPVLFNIYINDLPTLPESCTLESYVDDSKLFLSFQVKDSLDVATQVNDDLKRVAYWCSQNSLLINPTKTKVLVVGTRQMLQRVPSDFKLVLLGKELAPVPSVKGLGLFVDSTLSFDEHITITVSSCMASLVQINRVKHLLDVKTLENVINALVFSKLFYCCTVWSSTSKKNVKKLQHVQSFAYFSTSYKK